MAKPKGYDIPNPEIPLPESSSERKVREKREKKFRKAAFSLTQDRLQAQREKQPRHAEYDNVRHKGDRAQRSRNSISDERY